MVVMLVLLKERNYEVHFEVGSDGIIYIPDFMKFGRDVEGILRFWFSSFDGCSVGITDERFFFKCSIEMNSGGMIYVPSSMTIGSEI
jgi:hypothetical protein